MKVPGITLSNRHILSYVIASGGHKYDGYGYWWDQPYRRLGLLDENLFTIIMKTVTLEPRQGNYRWWNPFGCVRFIQDGVVNSFGLANPGFNWWYETIGRKVDSKKVKLIASILGEPHKLATMAQRLNDSDILATEVNISCPNTGDDLLQNAENAVRSIEAVGKVSHHPVIAKLSVAHDLPWITRRIQGMVEAIDINSVPWRMIFQNTPSPLAHLGGGGVSGKVAQSRTWKMVEALVNIDIPVIGPSIWDYPDIDELIALGARAVSFGSCIIRDPSLPTRLARRHMELNKAV